MSSDCKMKLFSDHRIPLPLLIFQCLFTTIYGQTGIKIKTINQFDDLTVLNQYTALIGSKIELPCNVAVPSPEDAITLIFWYKNDRKSQPIYSVDGRNVPVGKAPHFISPEFRNRAKFDLSVRPALLVIDPLKDTDSGLYFCRVDFKWARTTNTLNNLTIIDAPKAKLHAFAKKRGSSSPSKSSSQDDTFPSRQFLVSEGDQVVLQCKIKANPPVSLVKWLRNDKPFEEEKGPLLTNITIKTASSKDSGIFKCIASNSAGTTESGPLELTVLYPPKVEISLLFSEKNFKSSLSEVDSHLSGMSPPEDVEHEQHHLAEANDSSDNYYQLKDATEISLMCKVSANPPVETIRWHKDDVLIERDASRNELLAENSTLTINANWNSTGSYKCSASNIQGNSQSKSIHLSVLYAPIVQLHLLSNRQLKWPTSLDDGKTEKDPTKYPSLMVKKGDEIILQCKVRSNPPITLVEWFFNGMYLQENSSKATSIGNATVTMRILGPQNSGTYKCSASNAQGFGESEQIRLTVLYSPVCDIHRKRMGLNSDEKDDLSSQLSRISSPFFSSSSSSSSSESLQNSWPIYYTYHVSPGEQVNLTCTVDANPQDVSFHWTFNGTEIRPSSFRGGKLMVKESSSSFNQVSSSRSSSNHGSSESVFQLTPRSIKDFGLLACRAKNMIGSQTEPCLFALLPTSLSTPLESCSISNQTWDSLLVECIPSSASSSPSPFFQNHEFHLNNASSVVVTSSPITYHLEIYHQLDSNSQHLTQNLTNSGPLFLVSGLLPGTTYTMKVYSSNSRGKSSFLMLKSETLTMLTRKQDFSIQGREILDSHILLPILVSTCLTVIIVVLAFIVLRIRKRGKRRFAREKPAESSKVVDEPCKYRKSDSIHSSPFNSSGMKSDFSPKGLLHQHLELAYPLRPDQHSHQLNIQQHSDDSKWILMHKTINPDVIPQDSDNFSDISKSALIPSSQLSMSLHGAIRHIEISPMKMDPKGPHVTLIDNRARSQLIITSPENIFSPEDAFEDTGIVSLSTAV